MSYEMRIEFTLKGKCDEDELYKKLDFFNEIGGFKVKDKLIRDSIKQLKDDVCFVTIMLEKEEL